MAKTIIVAASVDGLHAWKGLSEFVGDGVCPTMHTSTLAQAQHHIEGVRTPTIRHL